MKEYLKVNLNSISSEYLIDIQRDLECDISWLEQELSDKTYIKAASISDFERKIKNLNSMRDKVLLEIKKRNSKQN
tara:strand:+ start:192 stop:419 length:228 start_codon:yes stop_codon:yes gene_type:complete